ncbi:MAG: hypothetical protein JNL87_12490 [Burkholderiaceae bacterium]|nr:hypothetical protein [Burkholderiaceae bacterium]
MAGALLALCESSQAQSNDELKARLDEALKTIQDLQGRVKALEQQRPPAAPPGTWGAPVVAPAARAEEGAAAAAEARVEVYGQVMLDAVYDARRMHPDWSATLRPSQIPVNCPADPGCGKSGATNFSIRQSSLGVRGFIPSALGLIKTDLSFDLFGNDGSTQVHWLKAWAELGRFGVGQNDSNFMDIDVFPNTIDYWGPSGMVFLRNPQLRFTPYSQDGMGLMLTLEAPNTALDTGKISLAPEFAAGFTSWNRWPDAVASLRIDRDWGHFRAAGILRQVGYQNTTTPDGKPSGHETGYGLNLSGALKVFDNDRLTWQLVAGKAIASYMDDGGVDIAPDASLRAEAVASVGWLAYYGHAWNDRWSSSIGFSEHRQDTTDGQLGTAFRKGSYSSLNLLYMPAKNVTTGVELVWGELEQKSGASADDLRLQFSTKVSF